MLTQKNIMEAFRIFAQLSRDGRILMEKAKAFHSDEEVRGLLMAYADEIDCTMIVSDAHLYLVPLTKNSPYHVTTDTIKKDYFPSRALNRDVYLMYVCIIIFIGEFYDSYQSSKPTRSFITLHDWLISVNERLNVLIEMDAGILKEKEAEYEYNWTDLLQNWEAMDNIKEGIKRRTARTVSRMSFMHIVKTFMLKEGICAEIGPEELALTDKSMAIVSKYFMEYEYNRGIIEFLYQFGEVTDASDI